MVALQIKNSSLFFDLNEEKKGIIHRYKEYMWEPVRYLITVSTIDDKSGPMILRKNCRIGAHSVIMPGVTVGEDAVVGAF